MANFGQDVTVLKALIAKGAAFGKSMEHVIYNNGEAALQFAQVLLDAGADPDYIDDKSRQQKDTLLKTAVNTPYIRIEIAKLLIENGADVFATDIYGWSALKVAQRTLEKGHPEMQEVIDLINSKL